MGDIPILSGLLGAQLGEGLKQIVQQTFQKKFPWASISRVRTSAVGTINGTGLQPSRARKR